MYSLCVTTNLHILMQLLRGIWVIALQVLRLLNEQSGAERALQLWDEW